MENDCVKMIITGAGRMDAPVEFDAEDVSINELLNCISALSRAIVQESLCNIEDDVLLANDKYINITIDYVKNLLCKHVEAGVLEFKEDMEIE